MSNLKKENAFKNTKNFTPYGTEPEKDKIVKSNYWRVRLEMAKEGYGLNVLINDEDWEVREAVAGQGYGLNILVNDESWIVRKAVANQGYGLDILIGDEDCDVRAAVAEQGYGLDILINDKDYDVRKVVLNYLKDNNLTLVEWCNQNNKEIDLKNLAYSPYPKVRAEAVKSGYIYKKDEIYIDPNCKFIPYGKNCKKDKMIKSNNWEDRLKMAEESYGLDVLINDEEWRVRRAVADQGYGLDVLINDEDRDVRKAVANQGYGLDILIGDEDWHVRETVKNYLTSHNLTLEQWKSNQDPSELSVSISKAEEFNPLDINALKSEIQNLKDQINILTKENKSLKEALEKNTSLEKKIDEKEL